MKNLSFAIWGVLLVPLFFSCTPQKQHPREWTYRSTPSHMGQTPKSEYFIILGTKLAYGLTENDAQTMSHLMDQKSLHYKVYNRAHPNALPSDVLIAMKNHYYLKDVGEESGVVAVVASQDEIEDYLPLLGEMKKTIKDSRIRLAFLCEQKEVSHEPISPCIGIQFKDGVLLEESINKLWQRF